MADRQSQIWGVLVFEEGEEESQLYGVQLCEDQGGAPPVGTILPQMIQHGLYAGGSL